jgi:hypothetical protein
MERYALVPFKVSSRDLQLVGSAVTFTKRQSKPDPNGSQNLRILTAVETRILTAQFSGKLEISCREAEVLLSALNAYCETFRSRTKHQSLFQELHHLAERLADAMEGRKTRNHGRSPLLFIKPKDAHFGSNGEM